MIDDYFSEFETVSQTVTSTLDEFESSNEPLTAERIRRSNLEVNLRELKHCLDSIELVIRANGATTTQDVINRQRKYQASLNALQRRWLLTRRGASSSSSSSSGDPRYTDAHRRALVALEKTERANRDLDGTLKLAVESEEMGTSILTNLNSQRETIQRTQAGNYEGLGQTRRKEVTDCLELVFGIGDVEIIDDETRFRDHPQVEWKETDVSKQVEQFVAKNKINLLLTFDEHGVSKHPNHISCFRGVENFINSSRVAENLDVYYLVSVSIFRQYLGLFEALLTCLLTWSPHSLLQFTFLPAFFGLLSQKSQALWFRVLHVVFSRYSYFNQYRVARKRKPKDE